MAGRSGLSFFPHLKIRLSLRTLIYGQTFLSVVHLWRHLPVFYCFYYSNVAAIFQTVLFFFSVSSKMCICPGFPLDTLLTDQSFHNLAQHTIFISGYWPGHHPPCGTSHWHREGERGRKRGRCEVEGGENLSADWWADLLLGFGLLSLWPAGGN